MTRATTRASAAAPAPNDDPNLGQVLAGRYRVLRHLGDGQMAQVYVAEQLSMERNVAVKLLHADIARDDEARGRFRREVKVTARLRSPHTISCFDTGETDDGRPFIAMELLAGETLRQRLERDARISPRQVVEIAAQIGFSLDEAHEAGILHRDLKPENIFLCAFPTPQRPFVKVLDFGLAKLLEDDAESPRLTGERTIVGTPAYMAPEMIVHGRSVDHRADLYALGVICFEMLTGQRPFHGRTPVEMLMAHVRQPIPQASRIAPFLPAALDAVFDSLLAKRPDDGPQRATAIAQMIAAAFAA